MAPRKPAFDRATQDIGNMVEFGHVNTRVPDQNLATLFYVAGLGLTRDPYLRTSTDNMWINVGCSQFHLPAGAPQVTRGVVGLVVPDLDALERRLTRVAGKLTGTRFAISRTKDAVLAASPWGNRIRVHAPSPTQFGAMTLGIAYVDFACPRGSAAGIARFYRDILGAPAVLGKGRVQVSVGLTTELRFIETSEQQPDYDGNHIQVTLADFSGPYGRLLERGLISEESDESQYRFLDITDPVSGQVLLRLEHEVRSMRHPLFARPLVNRDADTEQSNYRPGADTFPPAMQVRR